MTYYQLFHLTSKKAAGISNNIPPFLARIAEIGSFAGPFQSVSYEFNNYRFLISIPKQGHLKALMKHLASTSKQNYIQPMLFHE